VSRLQERLRRNEHKKETGMKIPSKDRLLEVGGEVDREQDAIRAKTSPLHIQRG